MAALREFDVLVAMRERTRFPASVLERLPNLKRSPLACNLDYMDAAQSRGITVCGTPMLGYPAAELAWGLVMSLTKRLPWEQQAMRDGL